MKRFSLLLTLAIMMVGSTVFAGSIDYLSNQSAKYLMTFTRTASTDASADIVNYNPAGAAFLAEGFYIDLSSQTLFKPYSQDVTVDANLGTNVDDTYEQSAPTYTVPNLYLAYNLGQMGMGKLAVFWQLGIVAGGGSLDWEDGTAGTQVALQAMGILGGAGSAVESQSFEVSSVYYGTTLGAAYSFLDDMLSVSLAGRVLMPKRSLAIDAEYASGETVSGEFSYEAVGYAPIIGFDVRPLKELTLALRYEFKTALEFEYTEEDLDASTVALATQATNILGNVGIVDGNKVNYDLPAMLSVGAEYAAIPGLALMTSANIYFLSQADLGEAYDAANGNVMADVNEYFSTGWEVSLGATYMVMPELKVGLGGIWTESGAKDEYFTNQYTILNTSGNPPLDSFTIGLGATYMVIPNLDVTLSGSWTHYIPRTDTITPVGTMGLVATSIETTYEKDVYNIGLGVGYKI